MHITKKRRAKTGKRHYRSKSHNKKSHHHHAITHKKKSHHRVRSHRRIRTYRRIRRRNSDINGEKLVDDSVSVYNKEKDSGNIINGMRDFLHKKSFIM